MKRWHLTAILSGAALVAVALAPRLTAYLSSPEPQPQPMAEPVPEPVGQILVAPEPQRGQASGHLEVEASLDRTALLRDRTSDRFLTVTVTAPQDLGTSYRHAVDLAVVMDASGSMSARGKIDYAKRAAKMLASNMEHGDLYTLVTFADDATTIVPAAPITDLHSIHTAIDRVLEGGGTNLYGGMENGAASVRSSMHSEAVGRVILLSDGNANVGVTDPDALARYASTLSSQGISVSTVGLGLDYNEDLLGRIADLGGGTYDFVDDPRELEAAFNDELARSASLVARETTVHLDLPSGVVGMEIYGWDAARTSDGWDVRLGDIRAGESKKIVARVQVRGQGDAMDVASVACDWFDLVDDAPGHREVSAGAVVTDDTRVVEASVDRNAAVQANQAYGNWFLDLSLRAYERGDRQEARDLAGQGAEVLQQAAVDFEDDALDEDAHYVLESLGYIESYEPSSTEGKRAIKAGKEQYRGRAR